MAKMVPVDLGPMDLEVRRDRVKVIKEDKLLLKHQVEDKEVPLVTKMVAVLQEEVRVVVLQQEVRVAVLQQEVRVAAHQKAEEVAHQ